MDLVDKERRKQTAKQSFDTTSSFQTFPRMLSENIMYGASQSQRFVVGFLGISFSFFALGYTSGWPRIQPTVQATRKTRNWGRTWEGYAQINTIFVLS